ncbi:MAG: hypothetical protein E6Q97_33430 [Desulfurellales bacterium]|nr:MAG: hypothetical protein E6Q97_33430 [Desulfurellales bacterium]
MGVKISALLPKPARVDVSDEAAVEVYPLTLREITQLIVDHRDGMVVLFNGAQNGDFSQVVDQFPLLVRDLIAKAIRVEESEEIALIPSMPGGTQVALLLEAWRLTVPQPKKLAELLSMALGQLQELGIVPQPNAAPARPPIPDYVPPADEAPTT